MIHYRVLSLTMAEHRQHHKYNNECVRLRIILQCKDSMYHAFFFRLFFF